MVVPAHVRVPSRSDILCMNYKWNADCELKTQTLLAFLRSPTKFWVHGQYWAHDDPPGQRYSNTLHMQFWGLLKISRKCRTVIYRNVIKIEYIYIYSIYIYIQYIYIYVCIYIYIMYIVACISEGHLAFPKPSKLPIFRMRKGQPPTPVINVVRVKTPCQTLSVCGYCSSWIRRWEDAYMFWTMLCIFRKREKEREKERERPRERKNKNKIYDIFQPHNSLVHEVLCRSRQICCSCKTQLRPRRMMHG